MATKNYICLLLYCVCFWIGIATTNAQTECDSPFGQLCGAPLTRQCLQVASGSGSDVLSSPPPPWQCSISQQQVNAYSNCNENYVSNSSGSIRLEELLKPSSQTNSHLCKASSGRILRGDCPIREYLGLDMQCVEFSRSWLLQRYGATFESIEYAVDIFELQTAIRYSVQISSSSCSCKPETVPFATIPNNSTNTVPQRGDLIIYSTEGPGMAPTGHVCAVVQVNGNDVFIAEQNWANAPWPQGPSYSRILKLVNITQGSSTIFSLIDPPYQILGLKRV